MKMELKVVTLTPRFQLMRFLQDGWSCLKYIEVDVEGLTDTAIALNDSGCQLCAVNAETVRSSDLPVFGQVKLRGISDRHLVPADVVKIRVRLTIPARNSSILLVL